ncbi:hypothetical protein GCM10010869_10400 [Mesorhizobium tianshanense]|nr:hypothetical protein GCM10010869_10400 [Mesorhizobium tianshanense]
MTVDSIVKLRYKFTAEISNRDIGNAQVGDYHSRVKYYNPAPPTFVCRCNLFHIQGVELDERSHPRDT